MSRLGLFAGLRAQLHAASASAFSRNALWFTALIGFERLIAVAQTALISRLLGITEYGVYVLLIGTIGIVASVAGLQMGLTSTVFVAKYRDTEKAKAAAVISIVNNGSWIIALAFLALTIPFSGRLAPLLVGSSDYHVAVMLGAIFVGASIISGVQDGVAQGFEMFVVMARLKIVVAVLVLLSILPLARDFGLNGVLVSMLAGLLLKYLILERFITRHKLETGVPRRGGGVSARALIGDFAVPSMAVSLLVGFVTWLGMFLLSKQTGGFDEVAIAGTGLQWRGPVLLLTASLAGVAVPAFSRLSAAGDVKGARRLRRILSLVNLLASATMAVVLVAASGLIMSIYGTGFSAGRIAFCLIVVSTIPSVVANAYMQELVGAARMWRQFWMHCPFLIVISVSFVELVPRYQSLGYAASLLIGSVVLLAQVVAADVVVARRERFAAGA